MSILDVFKDANGKLSIKRVMGTVGLIFAMVIAFTESKDLSTHFLMFAGGCFGIGVLEKKHGEK